MQYPQNQNFCSKILVILCNLAKDILKLLVKLSVLVTTTTRDFHKEFVLKSIKDTSCFNFYALTASFFISMAYLYKLSKKILYIFNVTYFGSLSENENGGSPAGTLPPNFSMNVLKNSNCGKFNTDGFCEQSPTKNFNFFSSSGPIGHDILLIKFDR